MLEVFAKLSCTACPLEAAKQFYERCNLRQHLASRYDLNALIALSFWISETSIDQIQTMNKITEISFILIYVLFIFIFICSSNRLC